MLTDKAKKHEPEVSNYSQSTSTYEHKILSQDKKHSNVLPLERPKHTTGKLKSGDDSQVSTIEAAPENQNGTETVEIKSRMEAILARMKSRTANDADGQSGDPASKTEAHSAIADNLTEQLGEELERRRAAIIAIAREAEIRSRDAVDKFRQAEARLKEQTDLRLLAEERLAQLEAESKRWQDAAQAEELKRIEAEIARVELEERLKHEAVAREQAELARAEAEAKAAAAEKLQKEAEAKVRAAEEAARAAESLIYEADAIARGMEERCKTAEARLQREAELRALAEQMLKELASLSPHLELNWQNLEAALAQSDAVNVSAGNQEAGAQLLAQIESEQKARLAAEQALADAEAKAKEFESRLRKAEEKYKTTENGYKKVLRKQEEELRTLSEQVTRTNESASVQATVKSDDEIMFLDASETNPTNDKLKLVSYGALITLLLVVMVWLGVVAFQQF